MTCYFFIKNNNRNWLIYSVLYLLLCVRCHKATRDGLSAVGFVGAN